MMASFNVTDLTNFNYPANIAKFVDPLDPRFISQPYDPKVINLDQAIHTALPFYAGLGAYISAGAADGIDAALSTFYKTATSVITDTAPVQTEFRAQNKRDVENAPRESLAEPTAAPVAYPFHA